MQREVTVKFERFNLAFWRWREEDQLNIVIQVVGLIMTKATILEILIKLFLLWIPSRTDKVPPITAVNTFFIIIYLFVCFCVCFVVGYVTASLCNCFLEVLVDHKSITMHTYVHTYSHIYTHPHTNINFCLQYIMIVVWWYLVFTILTSNILTML